MEWQFWCTIYTKYGHTHTHTLCGVPVTALLWTVIAFLLITKPIPTEKCSVSLSFERSSYAKVHLPTFKVSHGWTHLSSPFSVDYGGCKRNSSILEQFCPIMGWEGSEKVHSCSFTGWGTFLRTDYSSSEYTATRTERLKSVFNLKKGSKHDWMCSCNCIMQA